MAEPAPKKEIDAPASSASSEADILDLKDDEGWEDAEPEEEDTQFISLMDDEVFSDINQMLTHCKEKHNLDFLDIRQKLALDFYGNIKLVNYIRSQVHSGQVIPKELSRKDFEDEKFLKPVLEDDAVLFTLDDLPEVAGAEDSEENDKAKRMEKDPAALVTRVSELEDELRRVQLQFESYQNTVKETLDKKWDEKSGPEKEEKERDDDSHYFSSYSYNGKYPSSK